MRECFGSSCHGSAVSIHFHSLPFKMLAFACFGMTTHLERGEAPQQAKRRDDGGRHAPQEGNAASEGAHRREHTGRQQRVAKVHECVYVLERRDRQID